MAAARCAPESCSTIRPASIITVRLPKESAEELLSELETIRRDGVSVSYGEYISDAVGIGAPVFDMNGNITASVGIIKPHSRIHSEEYVEELKNIVRHGAAELSFYMGHTKT